MSHVSRFLAVQLIVEVFRRVAKRTAITTLTGLDSNDFSLWCYSRRELVLS